MAASPSPDGAGRRPLSAGERIVAAGAIAVVASMLLPWYGITFASGLAVTGFDSFGFAHAALLITVAAAAVLIAREATGRSLARPLRSAELVIACGAWGTLLAVYLTIDRPDDLADAGRVNLRMGVFVALAGCVAIVVGGLRMRGEATGA